MRRIDRSSTLHAALATVVVLACLALSACGSSSSNASSATTAAASATRGGRFSALRECLQKSGVNLPQRTPGQPRGLRGGGILGAGTGPQLPKGASAAQLQAAIKKCGGTAFAGGRARVQSPAYRQALARFQICMVQHGVRLPAPNTSGSGPVFNTSTIDRTSSGFKAALAACGSLLRTAAGAPSGAGAQPAP